MSQYEKIKHKIFSQAKKILKRINPKDDRPHELTNQDIAMLNFSYSLFRNTSEALTDAEIEDLHNRLVRLDEVEMAVVRSLYWEGRTFEQIGAEHGKTKQWVSWKLKRILEKMR